MAAGSTRKPRSGTSRQTGAPTIADVAQMAGVSLMTVSRVINAESNVRDATREAVHAAIAKLNYAPNRAARRLAGAAQQRIGLERDFMAGQIGPHHHAGTKDRDRIVDLEILGVVDIGIVREIELDPRIDDDAIDPHALGLGAQQQAFGRIDVQRLCMRGPLHGQRRGKGHRNTHRRSTQQA